MQATRWRKKRFSAGTLITWTSQAQGIQKQKTGKVLAFLPRRVPPPKVYPQILDLPKSAFKSDNVQHFSVYDRYLVEVPRLNKTRQPTGKFDYYTPTANKYGVVRKARLRVTR